MDELIHHAQSTRTSWSHSDLREAIKRDLEYEEPVLRAPVEVAKGDLPILAISYSQVWPLESYFDAQLVTGPRNPFYALVESVGGEQRKVEALVKTAQFKPKTMDHLAISQEMARQLGIDPQQEKKDIRVLEIYQKLENMDLDKL